MSIPLFLPLATVVPALELRRPITLQQLCADAGVRVRASGAWTQRRVEIVKGRSLSVTAEPGDNGQVKIALAHTTDQSDARTALAVMAYVLHDLVAKESIRGASWSRVALPRGRPKTGQALTLAERQRRFRKNRG